MAMVNAKVAKLAGRFFTKEGRDAARHIRDMNGITRGLTSDLRTGLRTGLKDALEGPEGKKAVSDAISDYMKYDGRIAIDGMLGNATSDIGNLAGQTASEAARTGILGRYTWLKALGLAGAGAAGVSAMSGPSQNDVQAALMQGQQAGMAQFNNDVPLMTANMGPAQYAGMGVGQPQPQVGLGG